MKKIITLLTVIFSTLSLFSFAQQYKGKINGSVIDGNTKTIEIRNHYFIKGKGFFNSKDQRFR
ncbi:MAG: hypothetical protein WKG06_06205 [Segetibacter sp.]